MLKELKFTEVLQLLLNKHEPRVIVKIDSEQKEVILRGVSLNDNRKYKFCETNYLQVGATESVFLEVPDEYRYMNTEEVQNWISCVGYKNHQVIEKNNTDGWKTVHEKAWHIVRNPRKYQYRTVELIDGKPVYGEPQEFKVKV